MNQRGQVAGFSYTNDIPNLDDGLPTLDPFLWDPKTGMKDLGNFGDQAASVNGLNNRGEVVGGLWLPGNQQIHPFLWDGSKLIDMVSPPFGGTGYPATGICSRRSLHWQNQSPIRCRT